jgi:LPXTG-motif cell wall-anchored protein
MAVRLAFLLAALALALAAPAAALAQGAGDDQYTDPFGGGQSDQPESSGDDEPEAAPEPAAPEPAAPAPAAETAQQEPAADEPAQLPYTGADEGLVALAGMILLAGGIALRVRTT